jgi:uncharacterized membrane protein YfcA
VQPFEDFSLVTPTWLSYFLGVSSAFLAGFSKTGLPGVSIPAILLMAEAFSDNARASVAVIVPVLLVGDVFAVVWFHHHANWHRLWRLFPWVLAGMVPGIFVLNRLDGNQLRPWIGWLVLGMLGIELWRRWREWKVGGNKQRTTKLTPDELKTFCIDCELYGLSPCKDCEKLQNAENPSGDIVPHSPWFIALTGFLAGFSTFIANAAMPLMSIYLISQGFNKREFLGTAAWFFFLLNLSKVPVYFSMGMFERWMLPFDLWLVVPVLLGSLFGVIVLRYIPQKFFNALALLLAGVAALRLVTV